MYYRTEEDYDPQEEFLRQQQDAFYKDMYRSNVKKNSMKDAYFIFEWALMYRATTGYFQNNSLPAIDFKHMPGVKQALEYVANLNPYTFRYTYKWFVNNWKDEWAYWKSDDWVKDSNKGRNILEAFMTEYIVPNAKKYYSNKPKPTFIVESPETPLFQAKKEESITVESKGKGRPKGSKNKTVKPEMFMPDNYIKLKDNGYVDIDSFIMAIADLVWRQPGKMDGYYLNLINISEDKRKYINKLFMINSPSLVNKYWKIAKINKITTIQPLCKRLGYYNNKTFSLVSLTSLSTEYNIPKMTLKDRLQKMSIKDAISR